MLKIFELPRRVEELEGKLKKIKKRNENRIAGFKNQLREMRTELNGLGARIQTLERNRKNKTKN